MVVREEDGLGILEKVKETHTKMVAKLGLEF